MNSLNPFRRFKLHLILSLLTSFYKSAAFRYSSQVRPTKIFLRASCEGIEIISLNKEEGSRRSFLHQMGDRMGFVAVTAALAGTISPAHADVSDGTELPHGIAQFSRVLRLRSDIKAVKKRIAEKSSEMDKAEWDNVGQFLRKAYSTADDMRFLAKGISSDANKERALQDVSLLKQYAQAADVSVSKQDAAGFIVIADKMSELMEDFFVAWSDIPAEL